MSAAAAARRHGPSALGDDFRRFVHLTLTLAITDWKLRYFGSVLGYLWALMRPLLLFGVLYFVFSFIGRFGNDVPHYPVYLLTAIVLWFFFAEATSTGVTALVARENLLRKMRFPRLVVPFAVSLTTFFNLLGNLVAILVFALANGLTPDVHWLELPLLVLALGVYATGFCMLLSSLYVRYRDLQPIWDVALQALFYASPVLFVITKYPQSAQVFGVSINFRQLAMCNPIAAIFTQMRHAVVDRSAPSALDVVSTHPALLLVPVTIVFGVFALGLWVFSREAPRIAENL